MRIVRGPVESNEERGLDGKIVVDETQRRRSRFRTRTSAAEEVGVVVDGARVLSAGDVLEADDGGRFVVELESIEALVVEFEGEHDPAAMVVVGHAVGNRHWDLVAYDGRVYVPAGDDAEGRIAFLDPYLPPGATVRVENVEPSLFDDSEAGHERGYREHGHGDDSHEHGHSHEHPHEHPHDENHDHDHDHDHDHEHPHEHPHDENHDHDHDHEHPHDDQTHDHTHAAPTTMTRDQLRREAQKTTGETQEEADE